LLLGLPHNHSEDLQRQRWYDFSNKSEEAALREWCAENGIDLSET